MKNMHLVGLRFGKLLIVEILAGRRPQIKCLCDCGSSTIKDLRNVRLGKTTSCGCYRKQFRKVINPTRTQPEYGIWAGMLSRCNNPNVVGYKNYGGRGIFVCDRWSLFKNFFIDMGLRPSVHHSIDRLDTNKGYCKENCRWATAMEQGSNKRNNRLFEVDGIKGTASNLARHFEVNITTVYQRMARGWPVNDAFKGRSFC